MSLPRLSMADLSSLHATFSIKLKEEGEFSIDTPRDYQKVIFLHKAVGQLLSCPLGTLLELVDDGWTDETPTQSCPQSQEGWGFQTKVSLPSI